MVTDRRAAALARMRGALVRDEVSGRVGELMYVGEWQDPTKVPSRLLQVAFIRPEGGGCEWTTEPESVTVLPNRSCEHRRTEIREGTTYCHACKVQIYL